MSMLDINKNKNKEFWISHILVMIATIIGVYLAASAGLKSAVQFELIKSDRDSYYMRTALLDELNDNLSNMQKWGKSYRGGNAGSFWKNPDDYMLDTYVWNAMKEQAGTFEIPSSILTKIRRYYIKTQNILQKMKTRRPAAKDVDKMLKENIIIKSTTIKALERNILAIKEKLEKNNVKVHE